MTTPPRRLWAKGGQDVDALVLKFTTGDDPLLDARLVAYDVRASQAHVEMLCSCEYLSDSEAQEIVAALTQIGAAHEAGEWQITTEEEDCHTALENRLVAQLGEIGKKVHLGRSRNDQVLTALRLYLRDAVTELRAAGVGVIEGLAAIAAQQGTVRLPGYTHLQRAMPSTVDHWSGAFRIEIEDDLAGLGSALRRLDKNPLGSAAGYGVPVIELDRDRTTQALGFGTPHEPVTAVQLSRGKAEATLLFELSLLTQDCGRLASDLCLFATSEFGFVKLPQRFTTGSSIMPQKRNPDLFELIRGRASLVSGDLHAVLGLTAKLTSGYHRDLQLIKGPLFRAIDSTGEILEVLAHVLPAIEFQPDRTEAALDSTVYATEKAYRLVVEEGLSFREAYRRVAESLGD